MTSLTKLHAFFQPKNFEHSFLQLQELKTETRNDKRRYVTPDGNYYPSVTTFLGSFEDENPNWFAEWAKSLGGVEYAERESQRCCDRGEAVHKALEHLLLNKPDPDKEAKNYRKMYNQLKNALSPKITRVYALEACLYSDILKLAGRVDCVAEYDGKLSIVDFKTSTRRKQEKFIQDYFLQCTLYSLMLQERTGLIAEQLVVAISVENEIMPQIFVVQRKDYIEELQRLMLEFKGV